MPETTDSNALEYLDFDLEIGEGDGRTYPVAVLDSPSGETRGTMQWPYDEIKLRLQLVELENVLLRSATTRRAVASEEEKTVIEFGSNLFNALFDDEVRNRYEVSLERARMQGKGLRIKLRIQSPELAALPWEFLYDPRRSEYLCFSRQTPIVRYPDLPVSIQPMTVTPPLRILGMVASPRGLPQLDVRTEKERLSQPLVKLQEAGLVELHWLEGETWRDLQRVMRQGPWHVFHFIGHGGFDAQREEGFFALGDENGERFDLRATQLARLIADHTPLRLVVLNACEGGRSSQDDVFSSSASILLRGGVPAVLAMQYAITDRAAVEFARTFYEALADGVPVDTAVSEGRLAISLAFADTIEWGTPVLYLRAEDGILFEVDKSGLQLPRASIQPGAAQLRVDTPQGGSRSVPLLEETPPALPLLDRLKRVQPSWWIAGGIGLVLLCLLLALAARLPQRVTALLIPLPTNTPTATFTEAILEAGQTTTPEPVVAAAVESTPTYTSTITGAAPSATASVTPLPVIFPTDTPAASPTAGLFAGATQVSPVDGMVMAYVPAGEFQMGCDPNYNAGFPCGNDELDLHLLYMDAFWIDQIQVTNAMYELCDLEGPCTSPGSKSSNLHNNYYGNPDFADYPMVNVNWQQALEYCQWVGRDLPTEAQWEKAARGDVDTRPYPWGEEIPTCDRSNFNPGERCVGEPTLGGSYPTGASMYNVFDMTGNVWDWIKDYYDQDYYRKSPKINPLGPEKGVNRVIRGACWVNNANQVRVSNRHYYSPIGSWNDIGFRCAVPAAP